MRFAAKRLAQTAPESGTGWPARCIHGGKPFAMNPNSKGRTSLALLAAAVTPWAYPLTAAARTSPYAGFGSADASAVIAARERGQTSPPGLEASTALDTRNVLREVRSSTHEDRSRIAATVESAVDAASRATKALRDQAADLPDSNREQFREGIRKAQELEAQVRGSIQALRASTAENHAEVRDKLASDYEGYASAVGDLEAISKNATGTF